jgi:hypothetical protein
MVLPGNSFSAALGDLLGAVPAVTLIVGLVHLVAGHRVWVALLGLYGFAFGSTVGAALAERWFPGHWLPRTMMLAGAGVCSFGAVLAFHRVGVFALGALAAAVVGELIANGLGTSVSDPVLLATALTGAALIVRSVAALTHGPAAWSLGELDLWAWPLSGPDQTTQLIAWGVLAVLGVAIQRRA